MGLECHLQGPEISLLLYSLEATDTFYVKSES